MFREHISLGAVVAAVGVVLLYFYAIVTDPLLLLFLFFVTIIGSFLPDLDSDSGVPFYLVYGLFTVASGAASLYYMLTHGPFELYFVAGVPVAVMLCIWFGVGEIFKRFTHHRGIMHSIPAMVILSLLAYLAATYFAQSDMVALFFALATALGFLSHLVLDELYAENALGGNPFTPRRSLGSAVKLFSTSRSITIFTYALLGVLLYTALKVV